MTGLSVSACAACGWQGFPARVWCPRCGATELASATVDGGAVRQKTVVRHAVGRDMGDGVPLATVTLDGGGTAVVRLEAEPDRAGARVALDVVDEAPVGR